DPRRAGMGPSRRTIGGDARGRAGGIARGGGASPRRPRGRANRLVRLAGRKGRGGRADQDGAGSDINEATCEAPTTLAGACRRLGAAPPGTRSTAADA